MKNQKIRIKTVPYEPHHDFPEQVDNPKEKILFVYNSGILYSQDDLETAHRYIERCHTDAQAAGIIPVTSLHELYTSSAQYFIAFGFVSHPQIDWKRFRDIGLNYVFFESRFRPTDRFDFAAACNNLGFIIDLRGDETKNHKPPYNEDLFGQFVKLYSKHDAAIIKESKTRRYVNLIYTALSS